MIPEYLIIDGIKWWITNDHRGLRSPQPLCPKHFLRMQSLKSFADQFLSDSILLKCEDCTQIYKLPRGFDKEKQYVLNKVDSMVFKKMKFINIDNEATPIAEHKISSKDSKYFVTSVLTESTVGLRLIVYAGEKGKKDKTQIFIEPSIKRLAFDQKDQHPTEVFAKLEATFADGTRAKMDKGGE